MGSRVVITGLGPVANGGIGKEDFFSHVWSRHCDGTPVPARFTRSYSLRSRWYIPLPQFSLADYGIRLPHENIMQPADRMAVLGAKLAMDDAGLARSNASSLKVPGIERGGVILGTGLGSLHTALESNVCHCVPRELLPAVSERRIAFNRLVVPNTMPNSPAAWVSICFGLSGSCHTINASCASGTYAIGEAFRRIKDGYDSLLLAGGVESFQDSEGFMMRGFDALGVITQSADGLPRPFSRNRSGFLFAEGGACLLVLEELQHALRRGAKIYAELADFRANSDASNIVQMDSTGAAIIRLLHELSDGRKIDYLNTHGTGTVANDQIEANAIRTVFGGPARQPRANSTKGILGHTLGASGAFEAAVTALSLERSTVHGNLTDDPIPDLNLPLESLAAQIENALSVSYGFGGHNGGLLFTRYEPSAAPQRRPGPQTA